MGRKPKLTKEKIQKLFRILKPRIDPKTGKRTGWKGVTIASRELKVTPRTIYNYLEIHEKAPEREPRVKLHKPKYIEEWEKADTVKEFIKAREGTVTDRTLQHYLRTGMRSWRILKHKDPSSWTEEDYTTLWNHSAFKIEETGKISAENAVALRQWMEYFKRYDLIKARKFGIKGLKREKGKYKTHWLKSKQELEDVINFIEYPDTLIMFNLGIQCGARHSSLKLIKPVDIEYVTNTIYMREPKVKKPIERLFITPTLENTKQYIMDFNFKGEQKIFPRSMEQINEDLKQAGKKAGIPFPLTTHKAIKHTFVSLASNRGVSLDIVSTITGTDPKTLMDFYAGIGKKRVRYEMLGEEYKEEKFYELMTKIQETVRKRYKEIKGNLYQADGLSRRPVKTKKTKKKKPSKPRKINWDAVKKMVKTKRTPEHLKKAWKTALKLHEEGLSDYEVRKKMGWKT